MVQTGFAFEGWQNCVRLSNGVIEIIATTSVGPRIVGAGFVGQKNMLYLDPEQAGVTGGAEWRIYGGHRLWHAPESNPRSYQPDNEPVRLEVQDNSITLFQPIEKDTGIGKVITITVWPDKPAVSIKHRLVNHHVWNVELAAWPITVLIPGGTAIIPQEPYGPEEQFLLPARPMALWQFSKMNDPRWVWGEKYIQVKHDPRQGSDQKIGVANKQGWCAYHYGDDLFIKCFDYTEGAVYPDFGCNNEIYFNAAFLELESLSPLICLKPGEYIDHSEHWLFSHIAIDGEEGGIDIAVLPAVQSFRESLRARSY